MVNRRRGSMGKKAGRRYAVVWIQGRRRWMQMPDDVKTDVRGRQYAEWLQEQFDQGKKTLDDPVKVVLEAPPEGELFGEWVKRWLDARAARKLRSLKDDRSRLRTHVLPLLKDKPMATITSEDLQALVNMLDRRIHADEMSWRTAKNVWALVSKVFADARRSKDLTLRVRRDNPAAEVSPPDVGVRKLKTFLFPSELAALLACDRVPGRWKRLLVLSVYLYPRAGELEALQCEDIDTTHGTVSIHQATDRYRNVGEIRSTKTGVGRRFRVEDTVMPLLIAMINEAGGRGPIVKMPPAEDLAGRLRQYLEWAGVTRTALYADPKDRTRKRITWHDLRATGITWRAVRGDDPLKIQRAAGHSDLATTQGYIRVAEDLGEEFGQVFAPLPPDVVAGREL
ncbi:MAG: hypothetical protein EOO75_00490 [Myxococcales bacterium]|nr:MAG: hypothetical protein EOO75_00490 [Myxococcales bacterium]